MPTHIQTDLFNHLTEPSWQTALHSAIAPSHVQHLSHFIRSQRLQYRVYPPEHQVFRALNTVPTQQVRVVILGQDPYHGAGQADGLAFSVPRHKIPPPSLNNIFKALQIDLDLPLPNHGCLEAWAQRGVLLLNSVLTVRHGEANSHRNQGWEVITDAIIEHLNNQHSHLVFLFWGTHAQTKAAHIDSSKHCILRAPHPSPLSAYRGFLTCNHFSLANAYLTEHGKTPMSWQL